MAKRKRKQPHPARHGKHGNGLYLMSGLLWGWLPIVTKAGITTNAAARIQEVEKTTDGGAWYLVPPVRLEFTALFEGAIHSLYAWCNVRREGSGGTEWFLNLSPVVGGVAVYLNTQYNFAEWPYIALCFITPFIWLDGMLFVLIFALLRLVALVGIVLAAAAFVYYYK